MSWTGPVFPSLPGITFPQKKGMTWSGVPQDALSGKRVRFSLFSYPIYNFDVPFSYLRTNAGIAEWQTLIGFIKSVMGSVGLFGYTDPDDNTAVNQEFGTGDGTTLGPFQLTRALGGFAEPVFLLSGAPTIKVAGTLNTQWTVDPYGNITFNSGHAPANGAALTWGGAFYWPCRFDDDKTDFNRFMTNLYELKSLKFSTEKLA